MLFILKIVARRLLKTPAFTVAAIAVLATCLGANSAIFGVVDAILVNPLPFPASDRLMVIYNSYPGASLDRSSSSIPNYFDRRSDINAFASLSIFKQSSAIVGGDDQVDTVRELLISPEFFTTLGVPLALGRSFTEAQLAPNADGVAILSDDFWRAHFNSDPDVIGRTFVSDGRAIKVLGVLPRNFNFLSEHIQLFRPASHAPIARQAGNRHTNGWDMIGRLTSNSTRADAQAQIDALNGVQAGDDPHAVFLKGAGYHTVVTPLHDDYVRGIKPVLLLLQFGVLFLLVIGGVNLASLFLIRVSKSSREVAIRKALGASNLKLVLEVVMETSLLVACGGLGGMLLAAFGLDFFRSLGADNLPLGTELGFNRHVAGMACLELFVVEVLFVIPSVWLTLRPSLSASLHSEGYGSTASRRAQLLRHSFIVAQVVLAFVLLSSATLLSKSLKRALETPVGFSPAQIWTGNISLPSKSYENDVVRISFVERLLSAVRTLPGITDAAIDTQLPFNGINSNHVMAVEGVSRKPGENVRTHYLSAVAGDYWTLMGIPLVRGRLLANADSRPQSAVCVVDQAFAERYWPKGNPLGQRISQFGDTFDSQKAFTIVGVVGNVKQSDLTEHAGHGSVYIPYSASKFGSFAVVVKSSFSQASLASMMQKAVHQIDPGVPLDDLRVMQARIDDSLVGRRSPAILSVIFAAIALALSAIGTYGVLGYAVALRRREIGVRMALGATPAEICRQFLSTGLRLVGVGVSLGIFGAWSAGHALQATLYNISAFDAVTLVTAVVIISVITTTACLFPALRASRVDPLTALRAE